MKTRSCAAIACLFTLLALSSACLASFTNVGAGIPALSGAVAWGDYNNDGYLDLAIAGTDGTNTYARIYRVSAGSTFTDIGAGLPPVSNCALAWGDYDRDGDLDLAISGFNGTVPITRVYTNNNGVFMENTAASFLGVQHGALAWGDYDNDGRLDLVVSGIDAASQYTTRLYRNEGGGAFSYASAAGLPGMAYGSLAWGDADNDGDLDLAITGQGISSTLIYRNNGDGTFTQSASLHPGYYGSLAWGDYDNDGDLDLAVAGGGALLLSAATRIYNNDGAGGFTQSISATFTGVRSCSLAWGDYDNDGDLDLVISGSTAGLSPSQVTKLYRNNGDGTFTDSASGLTGAYLGCVALGDYDYDRKIDLAVVGKTAAGYTAIIYKNGATTANSAPSYSGGLSTSVDPANGNVTFGWNAALDSQTPSPGLSYNLRVGTASGKNDIFPGMANVLWGNTYRSIPALGNAQKNLSWTLKNLPVGTYYWSVQSIDTSYTPSSWSFENSFSVRTMISGIIRAESGLPLAGVTVTGTGGYTATTDSNGFYVLYVSVNYSGTVTPSKTGCTFSPASRTYSGITGHRLNQDYAQYFAPGTFTDTGVSVQGIREGALAFADYDRDGDQDLLVTGMNDLANKYPFTALYRNNGSGVFTDASAGLAPLRSSSVAWGDYNSDGYPDLAICGIDANSRKCLVYRNNTGTSFADIGLDISQEVRYVAWADYDRDGDLDLIGWKYSFSDNHVIIYRNDAGTLKDSGISIPITDEGHIAMVDIDNDGDLDLSVGSALYRNDSGTYTKITTGIPFSAFCSWADYDNDGDLDMATSTGIYRNDGNGVFTSIGVTYTAHGPPAWGDYTLDGKRDMVVDALSGLNYIKLYKNAGGDAFAPQDLVSGLNFMMPYCACADIDGDGDLDVAVSHPGSSTGTYLTNFYRNGIGVTNTPPSAPTGLTATVSGLDVTFSWDPGVDAETPSAGLSYSLRVGTSPGADNIFRAQVCDRSTGQMILPSMGNLGQSRSYTLRLPTGTYYWSVQSVDAAFAGSSWAAEQAVSVIGVSISGYVRTGKGIGLPGVAMGMDNGGLSGVTSFSGYYTVYAPNNWSGTLTPSLRHYAFDPADRTYSGLAGSLSGVSFSAIPYPVISGTVKTVGGAGIDRVTLSASGWIETASTDSEGNYSLAVPYQWSGTVTAAHSYQTFVQPTRSYTNVLANTPNQNYTAVGFADIGAILAAGNSVAWGDFDNDGDLDLCVGDSMGALVYRSDGGAFTQVGGRLAAATKNTLAWVDVDNDGWLDLPGQSGHEVCIYRNNGVGGFTLITGIGARVMNSTVYSWADYDNDGLPDLLGCGSDGVNYITKLFRNNGNLTLTEVPTSIAGLGYPAVAWGDMDNDGDLDLAICGASTTGTSWAVTKVYRNDGGTFTDLNLDLIGVMNGSIAWGDYDNDGDLDLAYAGANQWIGNPPYGFTGGLAVICRNDGGGVFTRVMYANSSRDASVAWIDWDNDGDLDLCAMGDLGGDLYDYVAPQFILWRNDGGDTFSYRSVDIPAVTSPSIAVGDYDNDGRLDIALAGKALDGTQVTRIAKNNTPITNTAPAAPIKLSTSVSGLDVTFSWLDGTDAQTPASGLSYNLRVGTTPGGGDIFSGCASHTGYRRIVATGNAQKRLSWTLKRLPVGTIYWSVQAVDSSYAGSPWAEERSFTIPGYRISGRMVTTSGAGFYNARVAGSGGAGAAMTDASGNYSLCAPTGWSGEITPFAAGHYLTPGKRSYSGLSSDVTGQDFIAAKLTDSALSPTGLSLASAAWGDYDNDGLLDIAMMGALQPYSPYTASTKILRSNGGTFAEVSTGIIDLVLGDLAWGDYDNDGDLDLAISGSTEYPAVNRYTRIYRNDGGTFTDIGAGLPGLSDSHLAWGDYDNDGLLDLAVSGRESAAVRVTKVFRNTGAGLVDSGINLPNLGGAVTWGDYDNDGDLDLAIVGWQNNTDVAVLMRNDTGTLVNSGMSVAAVSYGRIDFIDFDCDGWLDIASSGFASGPRLYRNNGDGTFTETTNTGIANATWTEAAWGDFTNDGYPDLALTSRSSRSSTLYRNNGDGTFTDLQMPLPYLYSGDLLFADYDNDGDLDLFMLGTNEPANAVICSIFRNDGLANTRPSAPSRLGALLGSSSITFSWSAGSDPETPTEGLTYNLRVGTAAGNSDVFSGMAHIGSGFLKTPALGNVQRNLSWTIKGLTPSSRNYYWSVQVVDSALVGSQWASEMQTQGDTTPPTVTLVSITPPLVKKNDPVTVVANAIDNVGVTSVTANGTTLVQGSGGSWSGTISANATNGVHSVSVVARDAAGNTDTTTGIYKTAPVNGITCRDTAHALLASVWQDRLFCLWGRVTVLDVNSFTLDDGSGPVMVQMTGHGLASGKYVVVRGMLNCSQTPRVIQWPVIVATY